MSKILSKTEEGVRRVNRLATRKKTHARKAPPARSGSIHPPKEEHPRAREFVPRLERFREFKGSRTLYKPFDIIKDVASEYDGEDSKRFLNHIMNWMNRFLNISPGLVSQEFRDTVVKALKGHTPRCSSLRAVFEGRVPGIPKVFTTKPYAMLHIKQLFAMCDLMDTLVAVYLEGLEKDVNLLDGLPDREPMFEEQSDAKDEDQSGEETESGEGDEGVQGGKVEVRVGKEGD